MTLMYSMRAWVQTIQEKRDVTHDTSHAGLKILLKPSFRWRNIFSHRATIRRRCPIFARLHIRRCMSELQSCVNIICNRLCCCPMSDLDEDQVERDSLFRINTYYRSSMQYMNLLWFGSSMKRVSLGTTNLYHHLQNPWQGKPHYFPLSTCIGV